VKKQSMTSISLLLLTLAYLFGSIPFGLLLSRLFKLPDPRTIGSKNIGATNMLRSGSKWAAALTLVFDALKGSLAVAVALMISSSLAPWAGIVVVLGHIWPIWLRFQGGKGLATAFGVILILSWPIAIACLITWLAVAFTTRYSSLAALISVGLSPLYSVFLGRADLVLMCFTIGALVLWTHRHNINRLINGKETKIGDHSSPPSPSV
jgi:glycerol-3-phosphate acyltransferase PlsY